MSKKVGRIPCIVCLKYFPPYIFVTIIYFALFLFSTSYGQQNMGRGKRKSFSFISSYYYKQTEHARTQKTKKMLICKQFLV